MKRLKCVNDGSKGQRIMSALLSAEMPVLQNKYFYGGGRIKSSGTGE
ncbi:MAG: hypothetical protein H7246_12840 [Phycisphaerae bacterium]|nr:hypothetical protein [Saprospiraceae bacterium]